MQVARAARVVFEVCPTSNLQSGVVGFVGQHPVLDLRYLNIPITINTDDPTISNTTLTDEYALAVQGLGLDLHDLREMVINAARAAFLPEPEKQALIHSLRRELGTDRYRGLYG
ncbi:MAG: hypothetical protein HC915_18555 [Anaerolineae bacterium]|nr:hypothetical protein [Anaerolineae bacterium]